MISRYRASVFTTPTRAVVFQAVAPIAGQLFLQWCRLMLRHQPAVTDLFKNVCCSNSQIMRLTICLLEVHVLSDHNPGDAAVDMHVWIGGLDLKLRIESGEALGPCLVPDPLACHWAIPP